MEVRDANFLASAYEPTLKKYPGSSPSLEVFFLFLFCPTNLITAFNSRLHFQIHYFKPYKRLNTYNNANSDEAKL